MFDSAPLPPLIHIPTEENKILEYWKSCNAFQTSLKQSANRPRYTFYDGPPFATGLPHYGHLLAGTIKDIVTRHAHQSGFHVDRRFGWDCHGLPVEFEVDKENNINGPQDVAKIGIAKYNDMCRSIIMRYSKQWELVTERLGRWIDFENDYRTMYPWFMESVWWVFKQLYNKGLVYHGVKVMPYSTACSTPLSNFEAGQAYRDVQDPAIIVSFPLDTDPSVELVAWTTTPWTLISNLALCVHPDTKYVKILDLQRNRTFILMECRLPALYKQSSEYKLLETFPGSNLEGLSYQPLFDFFRNLKEERNAFRVLCDTYVTKDTGTGIVHQAPYFGEDDFRVCMANGIIEKDSAPVCPVDECGRFTSQVPDFAHQYVKDADKAICQALKQRTRLVHQSTVNHSYPFCWRSDTPLIYKALPTWFVAVEGLVERLLANNSKCHWVPEFVREGRFANWLRDARDWSISRNRFWGTPIPLWVSDDMKELVCVGSIDELYRLSGVKVTDLHREFVDSITIPSRTGRGVLRRIPEVFDCWFESGSMPYAQIHYPFEHTKEFEEGFPADFIAEGIDQTRGWFYTLLVISTALFDKPPFKNLIVNGIVLAADGQKMSKRAKNYPDPMEVIGRHGADAVRLYLINSPVVRAQNLRFVESGVHDVVKDVFLPWYNALRFLLESSVAPYERSTGRKFVVTPESVPKTENFMDRWILSFTQSLCLFVHQELKEYRLFTVVPRLVKFIDHLVNWYVRMNRRRLKGDAISDEEDWRAALHTLTKVIYQMICLMAPFTPFITEFLYQHLRSCLDFTTFTKARAGVSSLGHCPDTGAPESVHYLQATVADEVLICLDIEETVAAMQAAVELGRIIRTRENLPLKAPLREAVCIHSDPAILNRLRSAEKYVVEELNVRMLTVTDDKRRYGVQLRGVLNHRTLGARLKHAYKAVVEAVRNMSTDELENFANTGSVIVCGHELSGDDMSVVYTTENCDRTNSVKVTKSTCDSYQKASVERFQTASDSSGLLVLLDTMLDTELEEERMARELVNRIQRTRKKAELVPEDAIVIVVCTSSTELGRVASPDSAWASLIQATVKQPLAIAPHRLETSDVRHVALSSVPAGWHLGREIIRDMVSIPPDDLDLVFYARESSGVVNGLPSPVVKEKSLMNGSSSSVSGTDASKGLPNVLVIHKATGRQHLIHLTRPDGTAAIRDSDDLLRKVRCAFGWRESIDLQLYTEELTDVDKKGMSPAPCLLQIEHILSRDIVKFLTGKTLYALSTVQIVVR